MDVIREGAIGVYIDRWGVKRQNHAVGHRRSEPCARLTTDEFAGAEPVGKDCLRQVARLRKVLDERLGVPIRNSHRGGGSRGGGSDRSGAAQIDPGEH